MVRFAFFGFLVQLLCLPLAQCGYTVLSAHTARQWDSANLTDLINQRSVNDDAVPEHVLELLKDLGNKPACHKAATHQLITSCQSIREDALNPGPSFEDLEATKSIFAARLAICELRGADVNTPLACKPLLSISTNTYEDSRRIPGQSSGPVGEHVSGADLTACLQVLEDRTQWWISYSNSRQHAALICDASRTEILKDEALNLFHLLTTLGYEISQTLADALQRATSQQEAEMAFAAALKDLHTDQLQDLAKAHQESNAVLETSRNQLAEAVHHVSDTIHSAIVSAADLKQMVEAIFLSAGAGGAELASIRFKDAEAHHEVAVALQNMVKEVTNNDFAILREGLSEVIALADSARDAMEAMHEGSAALQQMVQDTSNAVKETAEDLNLLQDATAAAKENVQVVTVLTDQLQDETIRILELFRSLARMFDKLAGTFEMLEAFAYSTATLAIAVVVVVVVAKLWGWRLVQYLSLGFFICYLLYSIEYRHHLATAHFYSKITETLIADKRQAFADVVISHPSTTMSLLAAVVAIYAAILHKRSRQSKLKARRTRVILPAIPKARTEMPRNQTWTPAPYIPFNGHRYNHGESDRSRRAQTTPPRL